jgi:hypothetical protein
MILGEENRAFKNKTLIHHHSPATFDIETFSPERVLGATAKSRKATISFVMYVLPSAWINAGLPLDGFS